jgi:hypothetical protein
LVVIPWCDDKIMKLWLSKIMGTEDGGVGGDSVAIK